MIGRPRYQDSVNILDGIAYILEEGNVVSTVVKATPYVMIVVLEGTQSAKFTC